MAGAFDFAGDAAQAIANVQTLTDQARKTAAFNALQSVYGPVAGDPDRAAKLQENAFQAQLDPLKIQQQNLENTGTDVKNQTDALTLKNQTNQAQREAGYRLTQLLKNSAGANGAVDGATFDRLITPQVADSLGIDQAHLAPLRGLLTSAGGQDHLDTIANALLGPTKVTGAATPIMNANGTGGVVKFDQYGRPIVTNFANGTQPTANVRAETGQANSVTGADRANTAANNTAFGAPAGQAPATGNPPADGVPRVPQGDQASQPSAPGMTGGVPNKTLDKWISDNGGIDGAIAKTASMPQAKGDAMAKALADRYSATQAAAHPANVTQPATLFDRLPPKGHQQAISQATQIANTQTNLGNVHQLLDQIDGQLTPYAASVGAWGDAIPGSAALNLKENLDALKSMGFMTALTSMKNAAGQTGVGRILQSEVPMLQKLYGSLEQKQTVPQLQFHLKLFRNAVDQVVTHMQAGFKSQWGTTPNGALGLNDDGSSNAGGAPGAKAGDVNTKPTYTWDPASGSLK